MDVELGVAVGTACKAGGVAQLLDDELHTRVVVQYPSRRDGAVIGCVDQRQCIGQFAGVVFDQWFEFDVLADAASVDGGDLFVEVAILRAGSHQIEKSVELRLPPQQRGKESLFLFGPCIPTGHLVQKQITGLLTVVDRVVHLIADQLVILDEPMIGTFGKEQGREVKRVDQPPGNLSILEEVFGVVVDDVVSAEILHTLEEG